MSHVTAPAWLRLLLAACGVLAGAALIWFVGPLVAVAGEAPLAGEPARWAAIGALVLLALALGIARVLATSRRRRRLLAGLVAGRTEDKAEQAAPGAAEVALLSKRFERAVATLKRARLGGARRAWLDALGGRPTVDQLPWYIIIGAPGAGKTTALLHSGLEFPLAQSLGEGAVAGVGGTRNCDWWFSSEAVLIDTAGRYTTHDSDRATDRAAWFGFLGLLARWRPRQPINGVLLTLSTADLLGASPARRRAHAAELRERIEELHAQLGIAFPIYVLVTKTDLLAGFMEFFGDFDKDERAQVWGSTFPWREDSTRDGPQTRVASDFAALEKRLNECLLDQLSGETDRERRAAIFAFPQQWRVLRQSLFEFLQAMLGPLRAELRPCVRGVYFTSATQEGTPIDRALGGMLRALGLHGRVPAPARPSGKTFFMTRLLRDVVFTESGLAGTNLRWRRRRALLQGGVALAALGSVAAAALLSWHAYSDARSRVAGLSERLPRLERQVASAKATPPTDLPALLPVLDELGRLGRPGHARDGALDGTTRDGPLERSAAALGLDRSAMLNAAAHDAYERTLREAFLPRIASRLEARLRAGERDHVELIYDTLKAYLMLFGGRNFEPDALRAHLLAEWSDTLPQATTLAQRQALQAHLDRLLASGEVGAPSRADPQLVARSRQLVASVAPAQLAYQRLKQLPLGSAAAPFSAETGGGVAARRAFTRASGRALDDGIAALYSRPVALQGLPERTQEVLRQFAREQGWVLGSVAMVATDAAAQQALAAEVRRLYLADFAKRWEDYVGDLRLAPTPTLAASAEQAALLARADSPLLALLRALARALAPGDGATAREPLVPRLEPLRRWSEGPGPEALLSLFGGAAAHLAAADDAVRRGAAPPSSPALRELAQAAQQVPEPLREMLAPLTAGAGAQVFAALREPLSRQVAGEIGPQCSKLVAGLYPLLRSSPAEISREAFGRTFAAGGLLDEFFQRQVAAHVDTTTRPWTFRGGAGAGADVLQPFQRAQAIRDAFFRDGGKQFGVTLELRLVELDPGLAQFTLDVDGQTLRFKPGAAAPQNLQWPGPGAGAGRIALQLTPTSGAAGAGYVFEGPWALFRLLDRVRAEAGPTPERWRLVFDVEGHKARFDVKAPAALNPIARQELEQFQCPKRL